MGSAATVVADHFIAQKGAYLAFDQLQYTSRNSGRIEGFLPGFESLGGSHDIPGNLARANLYSSRDYSRPSGIAEHLQPVHRTALG
jgi:hypothetical protein